MVITLPQLMLHNMHSQDCGFLQNHKQMIFKEKADSQGAVFHHPVRLLVPEG